MTDKTTGLANHPRPVAAQHLMAAKALPETGEAADGIGKVHGTTGQGHRIDRSGRRADDHGKGIGRTGGQQIGNAGQHTNLISGAGATAREDQSCDRLC
ncbi:hypothetical protein D3C81_1048040 [compost metagenome]